MEFKNEVYMKKNVNLVGGVLLILLSSCSNFSEINNVDNEIENYESTPRKEAELYISNMYIWDNISMGRSLDFESEYPSFLSTLSIEDSDGNPLSFDDFDESEKRAFADFWYETEVNMLTESLAESEAALEYIKSENSFMNQAQQRSARYTSEKKTG